MRVRYCEYVGDIFAPDTNPTEYTVVHTIRLNPGLIETSPWLAPIANQYEQWKPLGIAFRFASAATDYAAQGTLGQIMMATDYDDLDPSPPTKVEFMNMAYSSIGKVDEDQVHVIECAPRANVLDAYYVRNGAIESGDNIRFNDLGVFYVATSGTPTAGALLGSLFMCTDIEFSKAHINTSVLVDPDWLTISTTEAASTPVNNWLGDPSAGLTYKTNLEYGLVTAGDAYFQKFGYTIDIANNRSMLVMPLGRVGHAYQVTWNPKNGNGTYTGGCLWVLDGGTFIDKYDGGSNNGTNIQSISHWAVFRVDSEPCTVSMTTPTGTLFGTNYDAVIVVTEVNPKVAAP